MQTRNDENAALEGRPFVSMDSGKPPKEEARNNEILILFRRCKRARMRLGPRLGPAQVKLVFAGHPSTPQIRSSTRQTVERSPCESIPIEPPCMLPTQLSLHFTRHLSNRGRAEQEVMPTFRKFDPKLYNPGTGRRMGSKADGLRQQALPAVVPFSKVILAAFMAHQVYSLVKGFISRRRRRGGGGGGTEEEQEAHDESAHGAQAEEGDRSQEANQAAMTQAMIRKALSRPESQSMPKRMNEAHQQKLSSVVNSKMDRKGEGRGTQQQLKTSKGLMGGPKVGVGAPGGLRMREAGLLGRVEVERKIKAAAAGGVHSSTSASANKSPSVIIDSIE